MFYIVPTIQEARPLVQMLTNYEVPIPEAAEGEDKYYLKVEPGEVPVFIQADDVNTEDFTFHPFPVVLALEIEEEGTDDPPENTTEAA